MNIFTLLLTQPLANGLILFYRVLGSNLGLAIIVFGLFLRFITTPLTKPYMESMKKMKNFAPQLDKLKKKHAGDKIKLAQAQADFYKQNGVNPGAGCLPYLLQIVILIAFFNVFSKTLRVEGDLVANFNTLLYDGLKFAEGAVINVKFLYMDLAKPDIFKISGLAFPIPGPTLILAAILQFLSAKIMAPAADVSTTLAKKTKTQTDDMQASMQKSMIYTFPLLTLVFGMSFPSGLALYWLMFSLYQMVVQYKSSGWGGLTPWVQKWQKIK